jgi:hypothetical protein
MRNAGRENNHLQILDDEIKLRQFREPNILPRTDYRWQRKRPEEKVEELIKALEFHYNLHVDRRPFSV